LNGCIHEIVEDQALDTPDNIAVLLDGARLHDEVFLFGHGYLNPAESTRRGWLI